MVVVLGAIFLVCACACVAMTSYVNGGCKGLTFIYLCVAAFFILFVVSLLSCLYVCEDG